MTHKNITSHGYFRLNVDFMIYAPNLAEAEWHIHSLEDTQGHWCVQTVIKEAEPAGLEDVLPFEMDDFSDEKEIPERHFREPY